MLHRNEWKTICISVDSYLQRFKPPINTVHTDLENFFRDLQAKQVIWGYSVRFGANKDELIVEATFHKDHVIYKKTIDCSQVAYAAMGTHPSNKPVKPLIVNKPVEKEEKVEDTPEDAYDRAMKGLI